MATAPRLVSLKRCSALQNILITKESPRTIKIADFGLAKMGTYRIYSTDILSGDGRYSTL